MTPEPSPYTDSASECIHPRKPLNPQYLVCFIVICSKIVSSLTVMPTVVFTGAFGKVLYGLLKNENDEPDIEVAVKTMKGSVYMYQ